MSDDLSRLTQQLRSTARELAPTQPAASGKLRSALSGLDENDLGTRLQHSSDGLRSGGFSDPQETALTNDLQKLSQQVGEAARALGNGQYASKDGAINRAMDDLARLRDQLSGLGGRPNSQPGQGQGQPGQGQPGQGKSGQGQPGGQQPSQLSRDGQSGQGGQQPGQGGGQGQPGQMGQRGGANGQPGQAGDRGGGPVANGGGGRYQNGIGAYNSGGNSFGPGQARLPQGGTPGDTQREIDQGLNVLNQVRAVVQDSPEARQQLQSLIDQMRNLDPSRFPGNPALVEQMHQQLVANVDALRNCNCATPVG